MPAICLITALPAEARPLIAHFGLHSLQHETLKIHAKDSLHLLQTGIGKLNAAASTAVMLQTIPDIKAVINVGIAGSQHPLETVLVAHQVQDQASGQKWFPHLPSVRKLGSTKTLNIMSVDKPCEDYTADTAFDMEASGVFAAATRTLDLAFVHSIKVVSDNQDSSLDFVSAASVKASIQHAIPIVEQLIDALPFDALPSNSDTQSLFNSLSTTLHYTETERHALRQLLQRHVAIVGVLPEEHALLNMGSAKAIRQQLNKDIDNACVRY